MNHMRKRLLCTFILCMLLMLSGCQQDVEQDKLSSEVDVEIVPSDRTLMDVVSLKYSAQQLEEISALQGTMEELDALYPIECVREDNIGYRVSYLGETEVAVLYFDTEGKHVFSHTYKLSQPRSELADISLGQTLEDVQEIDPDGRYLFLYTGINEPRVSEHYTEDGYYFYISYDEEYTVIQIIEELI